MPQAVARLVAIIREIAAESADGGVAAARFRDRINVGRKLAIQILEFFDASGMTRRTGDVHHLR
jgi:selenocysteine-specific elongation factor